MKKITSFSAACKALGISDALPDISALPLLHQKAIIAHYKLVIITQALNEGWQPDWKNSSEPKYYPWFVMDGFSFDGHDYLYSTSHVGSRLCFRTAELATYAGTKFKSLYKDYFILSKQK